MDFGVGGGFGIEGQNRRDSIHREDVEKGDVEVCAVVVTGDVALGNVVIDIEQVERGQITDADQQYTESKDVGFEAEQRQQEHSKQDAKPEDRHVGVDAELGESEGFLIEPHPLGGGNEHDGGEGDQAEQIARGTGSFRGLPDGR